MSAFVYFVQAGARGPIKIGFTWNVKRRMDALQTGCPRKLILLGTIECENAQDREAELHRRFADLRIDRSEWFRWSPALADAIATEVGRGRRHRLVTQTVTYDWHKPLCSSCGEPIEKLTHCLAGWFDDEQGRAYWPFVCHIGERCDFYRLIDGLSGLQDLPIDTLRRAPMEAVMPALRRGDDGPDARAAWARWVSIVLGLAFCQWDSTLELKFHGEVTEVLSNRVPLDAELYAALDEARAQRGGVQ
jgi:hypothetical protein